MKSKVAAGLLAIFLGGFGVHKFYLGRAGQGLVYLLFCWTFIPAVIGFVEGIVYLFMSDEEFHAKYNAGHPLPLTAAAQPLVVNVQNSAMSGGSLATELQALRALRDEGELTAVEFEEQKRKLLGR